MIDCLLVILFVLLIVSVPIYLLAVFIMLAAWRGEVGNALGIIKRQECPRRIAFLQESNIQKAASSEEYEKALMENGKLSRLIAGNRDVFDNIYKIDKKVRSGKLSFKQLNTTEGEFEKIIKWGEGNFPRRRA